MILYTNFGWIEQVPWHDVDDEQKRFNNMIAFWCLLITMNPTQSVTDHDRMTVWCQDAWFHSSWWIPGCNVWTNRIARLARSDQWYDFHMMFSLNFHALPHKTHIFNFIRQGCLFWFDIPIILSIPGPCCPPLKSPPLPTPSLRPSSKTSRRRFQARPWGNIRCSV